MYVEHFSDSLEINAEPNTKGSSFSTYEDLRLWFGPALVDPAALEGSTPRYPSTFLLPKAFDGSNDKMDAYYSQLQSSVVESIKKSEQNHPLQREQLRVPNMGLLATPVVTADKTLFGIPPGENLAAFLSVAQAGQFSCYIISYPKFEYSSYCGRGELSVPFTEVYTPGICFPWAMMLKFSQTPPEKYDSLTLHFECQVTALSSFSFTEELEKGLNPQMSIKLSNDITLHFAAAR